MKRLLTGLLLIGALAMPKPAYAFNLISDIQAQTKWDLGNVLSAGTAVNLLSGQMALSEFAEIFDYRFMSLWYGGIQTAPQGKSVISRDFPINRLQSSKTLLWGLRFRALCL